MSRPNHNPNLRELFGMCPLDCESYGKQWLERWEEAFNAFLIASARIEWHNGIRFVRVHPLADTVGKCLLAWIPTVGEQRSRIVLANGTVIKEFNKPA